jgi:hypothetical protein
LVKREKGLLIIITPILSIGGLLITLVITDTSSVKFLVVLPVSHTKAAFTAINIRFLSIRFLVVLIITEFLSHVKTVSAITRPRLSGTGLLVIIVVGFPAANVISIGSGVGFSVVLITLLNVMFLLLIKVTFVGGDTTAYTKPLILLRLNTAVFLDLN